MRLTRSYQFESRPLPPKPTAGGLGLVGAVLLVTAGVFAMSTYNLQQTGVRADATVVKLERSDSTYYPVFEFEDAQGRKHTVRSAVSSKDYLAGDTVAILYDPDNPLDANIDKPIMLYLLPGIFSLIGILLLGAMLLIYKGLPFFERMYDRQRRDHPG